MQSVSQIRWGQAAPEDAPTQPRLTQADIDEALPTEARKAPPDWVAEAARKYAYRIRDWAAQSWMLTHSPRRFAAEWAAGTREALNPLRFLAVGTTVTVLAERGARWIIHLPTPAHEGWVGWLQGSLGQMLNLTVTGALMHVMLRRRSGAPFRSTLGAAVFAAGGPGTLSAVVGWTTSVALFLQRGHVPLFEAKTAALPIPVLVSAVVDFVWTVATIAGVHRTRWWAPLLAFVATIGAITLGAAVLGVAAALVAKRLGY